MKILMVNKFYYIKGGSETYYFALKRLLKLKGHTVVDFSMKDEKNFPSPYERYFVDNVDYNGKQSILDKIKMGMNIVYSFEAKKKLEQLIIDTKPDIAHLHIFQHQLSPSILDVFKKYNIPVVYTAHDLKMLCPNYKMLTHGRICEECKGDKYTCCLKNKCVKDSNIKSLINVIEAYFHKWKQSYDIINTVVTPSAFYRNKFIEFGIKPQRVIHIPNFLDVEKPNINASSDREQYFLYFGRLSEEKGIMTLIKAIEGLDTLLYIVGTGPCKEEIESYIGNNGIKNIKVLGFKRGQELTDIIGNSKAVILPSEWYENGPYTAIEALQLGRPLIGSDLGGIPELIDGNGFVFEHGNVEELKEIIEKFSTVAEKSYQKMCVQSIAIFMNSYTANKHCNLLLDVYSKVLAKV